MSWPLALLTVAVYTLSVSGSARASGPYVWTSPASIDAHAITAVACPSPSLCVAVDTAGGVLTTTNPASRHWTLTTVPGAAGFSGVSCPSTSLCVAVDIAGNVVTSSDPSGGSGSWGVDHVSNGPLSAVSCPTVALCATTVDAGTITSIQQASAAGTVMVSADPQAAGSWNAEHADSYLGFECGKYGSWIDCSNAFTGLSCPTTALCVAADEFANVVATAEPAAGVGAFWFVDSAVGAGSPGVNAVSCSSGSSCVGTCVVGFGYIYSPCPGNSYGAGDVVRWNPTAAEYGDNSSVSYATIADAGLSGVWCSSTSLCFAAEPAGNLLVSSDPAGGASTWSVSYVDSAATGGGVTGVACSVAFCVAVDKTGRVAVGTLLNPSQVKALLRRQLVPRGKAARIGALIRHHGYALRFTSSSAGRLRISWYACPSCRHFTNAGTRGKVKVANATRRFASATSHQVKITLTRSGKRLLKRSDGLQMIAVAGFTPTGQPAITATKKFRIRR